jgi:adenine-specific DNA-methyltransferase
MSAYTVHHGDSLAVMRTLPDNSVDLIVTDPPYFRVKDEPWDRAWATADGFLAAVDEWAGEWSRLLKPNGSLYVFASPKMAARVECVIAKRFEVLTGIVWRKEAGRHRGASKEDLRAPFAQTERIVFAEHYGSDNSAKGEAGYVRACDDLRGFVFEPLRAYLDGERQRAGITREQIEAATRTQMYGHWFTQVQWTLPTAKHYATMRALFGPGFLAREHEDLRLQYEDLRLQYEDLRRPFNMTADRPHTDVWDFPTVPHRPGKHPCEKPAEMARHIVEVSSRPGAVVLDAFCGSGVFVAEAVRLGRTAIGIDADAKWVERTRERAAQAAGALPLALRGAA